MSELGFIGLKDWQDNFGGCRNAEGSISNTQRNAEKAMMGVWFGFMGLVEKKPTWETALISDLFHTFVQQSTFFYQISWFGEMRYPITIFLFHIFFTNLWAQELNLFYSEPHQIKKMLNGDYRKISIQVVYFHELGAEKLLMPYIFGIRSIEFKGDSVAHVIQKSSSGGSFEEIYYYNLCGNLVSKKTSEGECKFIYIYDDCRKLAVKSIRPGLGGSQSLITKFQYDSVDRLIKEDNYILPDSVNIVFSKGYAYLGSLLQKEKEFYLGTSDSMITEYYYNLNKIDSTVSFEYRNNYGENRLNRFVNRYSSQFPGKLIYSSTALGTFEYTYNSYGRLTSIVGGPMGKYNYSYNIKQDPDVIFEGFEGLYARFYFIQYEDWSQSNKWLIKLCSIAVEFATRTS